ncbi:MAG: FkbM family methyltransferase [Phycisphaerales bacterium]|nr:FkbM family methyltransferase [Phycisphaerales bacterium]
MTMTFFQCLKRDLRFGFARSPMGVRPRQFEFPATWEERVRLVLESPDNAHIPRVPGAGEVRGDVQIMHNGLRVRTDSYYGPEYTDMLMRNAGVHEPQEERVFAEVIRALPEGARMIELGAFWGFYSTWFLSQVKSGTSLLVEPMKANLESGRTNLALNGVEGRGEFLQGYVGVLAKHYLEVEARQLVVDTLIKERAIPHVDLLHADVQGTEVEMIRGSRESISAGKVSWVFLSTHSMHKHAWCKRELTRLGMSLVAEADLPESYSFDGLLVFKRPGAPGPDRVEISQRPYLRDRR